MDRLCYTVRQIRREGSYIKSSGSLIHCRKRNKKLAEHVADFGVAAEVVSDVEAAVHRAKELADGYDVILFAGSLYLIGDVRRLWRNERGEER